MTYLNFSTVPYYISLEPEHRWSHIDSLGWYICKDCNLHRDGWKYIDCDIISPENDKTHNWVTIEFHKLGMNIQQCQNCNMKKTTRCEETYSVQYNNSCSYQQEINAKHNTHKWIYKTLHTPDLMEIYECEVCGARKSANPYHKWPNEYKLSCDEQIIKNII